MCVCVVCVCVFGKSQKLACKGSVVVKPNLCEECYTHLFYYTPDRETYSQYVSPLRLV